MLQWGDLGSVIFAAFLLLSDKVATIKQIFKASPVLACCDFQICGNFVM